MFESLKENMYGAIHTLKGYGKITDANVALTVKEIQRTLMHSDVNYKIVKNFTLRVKDEAMGQKVSSSLKPGELFTKIVYDNLVKLMSCGDNKLNFISPTTLMMVVGLQGAGKTTFAVKLAKRIANRDKKKPLLVACDIYRPAAIEQLRVLCQQAQVDMFYIENEKNVNKIIEGALLKSEKDGNNVVIVDTAGRQSVDDEMMCEIKSIRERFRITESLLVLDSMIGQRSVDIAKKFNDTVELTGVILTKLDGDSKGGVALSVTATIGKPIKFIGTGEKLDDIDVFHPDRIANRILGKGDIISLVEQVQKTQEMDKEGFFNEKRLINGVTYADFMKLSKIISNTGLRKIFEMLPGVDKMNEKMSEDNEKNIKMFTTIINSMTRKERVNKCRLDLSRKIRIAKGSGRTVDDVNRLIKSIENMNRYLKSVKGKSAKEAFKLSPFLKKFDSSDIF